MEGSAAEQGRRWERHEADPRRSNIDSTSCWVRLCECFGTSFQRNDTDQRLGSCRGGPRRSCELRRTRGLQQRCSSTIISRHVRKPLTHSHSPSPSYNSFLYITVDTYSNAFWNPALSCAPVSVRTSPRVALHVPAREHVPPIRSYLPGATELRDLIFLAHATKCVLDRYAYGPQNR